MKNILDHHPFDNIILKKLLKDSFRDSGWLKAFLKDNHHGFRHGNQVRLACLKLVKKLNLTEKKQLSLEAKKISKINPHKYALLALEIAAIFHDCGRFNEQGQVVANEQKYHHILSAKRARMFCEGNGLNLIIVNVEEAILGHDYQNKKRTPDLIAPRSIIGKIVQSADQMGWFHPDSVNRTMAFNKALGAPFFNPKLTMADRIKWVPASNERDALTVMLSQLYGPTGPERFGIKAARKKIETYKIDLKKNILKIALKYNLKKEVVVIMNEYPIQLNKKSPVR